MLYLNEKEYEKLKKNMLSNPRQPRSLHKNNESHEQVDHVYPQAVEAIRYLQGIMRNNLHRDDVEIEIAIKGYRKGDGDNIFKAISDALQGIVYENDKQVRKGLFEFC